MVFHSSLIMFFTVLLLSHMAATNQRVSTGIGDRLLKGWTLLADTCPVCIHTPLVQSRLGHTHHLLPRRQFLHTLHFPGITTREEWLQMPGRHAAHTYRTSRVHTSVCMFLVKEFLLSLLQGPFLPPCLPWELGSASRRLPK